MSEGVQDGGQQRGETNACTGTLFPEGHCPTPILGVQSGDGLPFRGERSGPTLGPAA